MKILFINKWIHPKNMNSLQQYKKINFTIINSINDIDKDKCKEFDVIYSPSEPINVNEYKHCKFIFGPHFSVSPNEYQIQMIKGLNSIYIQPSRWVVNYWKKYSICSNLNIKTLPFGVDTEKFKDSLNNKKENIIFYLKRRNSVDINILTNFLNSKKINYKIFNYLEKYNENDYLQYLKTCKYGIWLSSFESQGFALQEALSCNVPLFVWNVISMNQEDGSNYNNYPATTIPYWDNRCGEFFYDYNELESTYNKFITNLDNYKPREYILENLSMEVCEDKLINLIKEIT